MLKKKCTFFFIKSILITLLRLSVSFAEDSPLFIPMMTSLTKNQDSSNLILTGKKDWLSSDTQFNKILTGQSLLKEKLVEINLEKLSKPLVVIFLSSHCPCSCSHEKRIQDLAKANPDFLFLGIATNLKSSSLEELKKHYQKNYQLSPVNFDIIADKKLASGKLNFADAFLAVKTPHAFVISQNGSLLYQGSIDEKHDIEYTAQTEKENYVLKSALLNIHEGKMPEKNTTKSLGCSIER